MEGVRVAVEADLDRLTALIEASIASSHVERAASLFRHPHRVEVTAARLRSAISAPDRLLLAGTIDEYVVGVALVSLDATAPHGVVGITEELYVEPEAREVGIGEFLLDHVVAWCREHHCVGIDIATLPGDRAAKNLCERTGFLARTLIMHRAL